MANPRRISNANASSSYSYEMEQMNSSSKSIVSTTSSAVLIFLKKPQAIPILLCVFVLLTWISIRLQHSYSHSPHSHMKNHQQSQQQSQQSQQSQVDDNDDDLKANLVRFSYSQISKDKRGWLLNPLALAHHARLSGGAVSCASVHVGQIKPGGVRGNHRHYTCNETFLIWGALTKFRLEKSEVVDKGYAEVIVGPDEVCVAASPSGTAHALLNLDPIRISYFVSCQDSIIDYNSSTTHFNIWKDL